MITAKLSSFAAATRAADVPPETLHMLRLSMLDWAACGIAGRAEPVARITRDMVVAEAGTPEARVFGGSAALPARAAALVNGATSHALDYDDTHFDHIGHPSVAVLPAVLAVAEMTEADGPALQLAALLGIEASIRVGVWLGRGHYQTGFHQTATAGAFGAAVAAARLLGFDAAQTEAALGLVATRASGLKSQFGTMGKPYNAGLAAANGVEAALLVQRGFAPDVRGLEGPQGFGATHAGAADAGALEGLSAHWRFDRISHKFHACCHGLHATLEALSHLDRPGVDEIAGLGIETHPRWMSVCNQSAPTTGLGAKFSYRTVAAMALLGHSTAALESYSDALCADPAIIALRDRVSVVATETLSETQARVTLTLSDGTRRSARHDLEAPIPLAERTAKIHAKSAALIGAARSARLWDALEAAAPAAALAGLLFA
ncbi:MmgE/PrpD family protein [Shimia sp.]|uniref:MmgE/PrpD family protein n=1 Tax=Shimia sp. TaxID=1954381 RepID=UPI0035644A68